MPPKLCLDRAIIVLTHPRTGSSLLMQTLKHLGADVFGEFTRPDLPHEANPRGVYEDLEVLTRGINATALIENPALLRGRAVKLSLRPLVTRRLKEEWAALQQPNVVLLLPIRSPTESIRSQKALLQTPHELANLALEFISSVRGSLIDHGFLAHWVTTPDFLRPPPECIDYQQAINDPSAYVDRVATSARLQPSETQRKQAIANIDSTLYRFRSRDTAPHTPSLPKVEILEKAYEILRTNAPDKWRSLQTQLPRWVTEAAAQPLVTQTAPPAP